MLLYKWNNSKVFLIWLSAAAIPFNLLGRTDNAFKLSTIDIWLGSDPVNSLAAKYNYSSDDNILMSDGVVSLN